MWMSVSTKLAGNAFGFHSRRASTRPTTPNAPGSSASGTRQRADASLQKPSFALGGRKLEHIAWYLERGEWQGRAGGYAIQGSGASLVERIEGDFTTVVGLPIGRLLTLLEECGLAPWQGPCF